jgi:hypothetical protein
MKLLANICLLMLLALIVGIAHSQEKSTTNDLQKSKPQAQKAETKPRPEKQGTEKNPLVIKRYDAEETTERREQMRAEREEKTAHENRIIFWTIVLAATTVVLAAIAAVQVGMFWIQLGFMREGVDDAKVVAEAARKSADAAESAIKSAENAARRQLCAYIVFSEGRLSAATKECVPILPPETIRAGLPVCGHLMFKNAGQTPAYDLYIDHGLTFTEWPIKEEMLRPVHSGPVSRGFVGPGDERVSMSFSRPLTTDDITAFQTGKKAIFVHGEVRYRDAFKKQRWTRFCYFMGGPEGIKGTALAACASGNDADEGD